MEKLIFDLTKTAGKFKNLNSTNGGPCCKRHCTDQSRSNFNDYKAMRMPYARNHDSGTLPIYGGPYSHDVANIFPIFDADENDPSSYDFACTDESILIALDAGTKTFFRLGQSIEHQIKKHGTVPPKDFHKWARICEHIIRHYTEGWADGFTLDMPYWEIWNEPDLDPDDCTNKRTWGGTKAEFFDFYEIAAKHLKKCFPHLKIGGPALAGYENWGEEFLREMKKRSVPIDFFSWHVYASTPEVIEEKACRIRDIIDKCGYPDAESILNEWNYVKGWIDEFTYSVKVIHSVKGAAFTMAVISRMQYSPLDMLMYYDTRPSVFNGAFDYYTYEPLKGYYPLKWYGEFYDYDDSVPSVNRIENVYSLCGKRDDGSFIAAITYYTDDDNAGSKTVTPDFGASQITEAYLLDASHDASPVPLPDGPVFELLPNSVLLLKGKSGK